MTVGNNVHVLPSLFRSWPRRIRSSWRGRIHCLKRSWIDSSSSSMWSFHLARAPRDRLPHYWTGAIAGRAVADANAILETQQLVREIPVAGEVQDYAIRVVLGTHADLPEGTDAARKSIRYGASPRAAQAIMLAGRVYAVLAGRLNVSFDDVRRVAPPALRHRIILTYEAEARGATSDTVIAEILESVPREP